MLRYANEKDVYTIYKLICSLEEEILDEEVFKRIYFKQLFNDENTFIVYEEESVIKGICHIEIVYHLHHCAKICVIKEIVVDEKYREQGIGSLLLNKAIDLAKENHCQHLELVTNQKRVQAHTFYENNGLIQSHYGYMIKV